MISLHTHSIKTLVDMYFVDPTISFESLVRQVKKSHGDTPETMEQLDRVLYA